MTRAAQPGPDGRRIVAADLRLDVPALLRRAVRAGVIGLFGAAVACLIFWLADDFRVSTMRTAAALSAPLPVHKADPPIDTAQAEVDVPPPPQDEPAAPQQPEKQERPKTAAPSALPLAPS